jgi:hypothetical protein
LKGLSYDFKTEMAFFIRRGHNPSDFSSGLWAAEQIQVKTWRPGETLPGMS